jgi:uncharacterized coiled-coil protein SlyX
LKLQLDLKDQAIKRMQDVVAEKEQDVERIQRKIES